MKSIFWIILVIIIIILFVVLGGNNEGEIPQNSEETNSEESDNAEESVSGATSGVQAPGNEDVEEMVAEEVPVDGVLEAENFSLVDYTNEGFMPKEITIKKGETVRFVNNSSGGMWVGSAIHPTHSVYPLKSDDNCLGSDFDQCTSSPGGSFWEFTFDVVGEHGYHNHVRASHWGKIIVE